MQCTANSAGECHLDVVEVQGSNPWPCKQKGSFERGCFFRLGFNGGFETERQAEPPAEGL